MLAFLTACAGPPMDSSVPSVETADEVCDDGIDNDLNGLVDCEDAACFDLYFCTEDCERDEDRDHDGLSGCADDDCWGSGSCQSYTVRALGGTLRSTQTSETTTTVLETRNRYTSAEGGSSTLPVFFSSYVRMQVAGQLWHEGFSGSLRTRSPGGKEQACNWTIRDGSGQAAGFGRGLKWMSHWRYSSSSVCYSTVISSGFPYYQSQWSTQDIGGPVFSEDCAMPASHRMVRIAGLPLVHAVQSTVSSETPSSLVSEPEWIQAPCGPALKYSTQQIRVEHLERRQTLQLGQHSTTWRF